MRNGSCGQWVSIQSNGVKMVSITLTSPLPQEPERVSNGWSDEKYPEYQSAKSLKAAQNSLTLTFGADGAVEVRALTRPLVGRRGARVMTGGLS